MKKFLFLMCILMVPVYVVSQEFYYQVGTTSALWKNPTTADFKEAKGEGINYIEVAFNQCYRGVPPAEVSNRIYQMKQMVDSAGIKVWSIHLPFSRTLDISVLDDSLRAVNVAFMSEMIKQAAMFNPQRLVLHPSSEPIADDEREMRLQKAKESIGYLKHCADSLQLQLCIENLPRTCLGNTPEELLSIVEDIPGLKVCFDTNHYFGGTLRHFIEVLGTYIGTIHASDYDFKNESHWLPTQGDINWKELVGLLQETGYRGAFMYEATKDRYIKKVRLTPKQVRMSFEKIQKQFLNQN
ncbi:sugar phosphate isomerase/epimerase family protein [uncultured Bacteroides sp.]|uniref:sugar phosphate isomerase/epimerase family protein n=1 Tax=uncultured Bacteroides sp. TaxID=162156 RepID=UPI0026036182|nr:sugar phosphate isomerase/epimerase family protein [uncultured Bacteroides sp.]